MADISHMCAFSGGLHHSGAAYLERRLREGFSPYAAIMCARRDGELGTEITPRTLYSYIYGQVLGVGAEVLVHGRRKKKATKEEFSRRRICGNAAKHPSIEERPKSVLQSAARMR